MYRYADGMHDLHNRSFAMAVREKWRAKVGEKWAEKTKQKESDGERGEKDREMEIE